MEFRDRRTGEVSDPEDSGFSVEGSTLHVGGRPYPLARETTATTGEPSASPGWRSWSIPFESGHQLTVGGTFNEEGRNIRYGGWQEFKPGLHAMASHVPTQTPVKLQGRAAPGLSVVNIPNPEEFHRRVKEVSDMGGGSEASR